MRWTDFSATIAEFVEDTTKGDSVSAETKSGKYVNEQEVCETHDIDGGKIVCVTVGGQIPMMIIETVSSGNHAHAHTYKQGEFQHLGKLREYGLEGSASFDEYDAEGWLDTEEFLNYLD